MKKREVLEVEVNRRGIDMGLILEVMLDMRELLEDIKEGRRE